MKDDKFSIQLGNILRAKRENTNINQPEMAKRLGVSKQLVSCWENGTRTMSAMYLSKYCKILGISIQSVFDQMED